MNYLTFLMAVKKSVSGFTRHTLSRRATNSFTLFHVMAVSLV